MSTPRKRLAARLASLSRLANPAYDGRAATEKAREGYWARLEAEVDPDGVLSEEERRRRAVHLWQANMLRGKLAASKKRRRRKAA